MYAALERENGISLPNNQRRHRTSHAPKDVLTLRICADYCAPCLPPQDRVCAAVERTFPEMDIIPEFRSKSSGYSIDMRLRPQYAPLPSPAPLSSGFGKYKKSGSGIRVRNPDLGSCANI